MLTYKTLVLTGLRCNELRSISVAQVYVDGDSPYIELFAEDEKNRQGSTLPLSAELATELAEWITETSGRAVNGVLAIKKDIGKRPLFSVPSGLLKILDRDLLVAGIEKEDSRGRTLDVHALRTTFGTMLSMAGVAPRTAQAAMRHSRIDLTMNIYTDPTLLDVAGAIGSLPNVRPSNPRTSDGLKVTGTNNAPRTVAPTVAPATVKTCQTMSLNGTKATGNEFRIEGFGNEKTLEFIGKTRVSSMGGRRGSNPRPSEPQSADQTTFVNDLQGGIKLAKKSAPTVAPTTGKNLTTAGNNWQESTNADDPRQAELMALWNMASETARAAIYATAKAVTEGLRNG